MVAEITARDSERAAVSLFLSHILPPSLSLSLSGLQLAVAAQAGPRQVVVAAAAVVGAVALVVGHVAEASERRLRLERPALPRRAREAPHARELGQGTGPAGGGGQDVAAAVGSVVQVGLQLRPQGPRDHLGQDVQVNLK